MAIIDSSSGENSAKLNKIKNNVMIKKLNFRNSIVN